ncbi:hypothetical protein BN863_27430 [Formosa agariphila KMM 3901]|uniref:Uncharacterized protein n=1 Tax=Formosa agariphila (strain DSM 15362 / KCTC 12365 / LMG 23005 / KMM 3901 / M-2Alg 35-1) TaxID=1347342 RepID=T2KNY7_FORAG|nr:hypothetical protein [Formosa agariphila]CDF80455.1 hypothetical protein BN863_27430 [Formosa agariphila KMM 3901]
MERCYIASSSLINNAIDMSQIAFGIYILKVNGVDYVSISKHIFIE